MYTDNKTIRLLLNIKLLALMLISLPTMASDLKLKQDGNGGDMKISIDNQDALYKVDAQQYGLENLLDLTIGADLDAHILQDGSNGTVVVDAKKPNNTIDVTQGGSYNSLRAVLSGRSNTSVINQIGENNILTVDLSGSHNRLTIDQSNANNKIDLKHAGSNGALSFTQNGSNNLLHINTQQSGLQLSITQSGHGESMKVHN